MVNSGFGANKSILIQRLAYEFQKAGELVFVFNTDDEELRTMLDLQLPADRYEVTGIAPSHPRRLRWNPLQIGRRIDPDSHIDTVVEIISNVEGLGPKQQAALNQALRSLYWELGALTNDPNLWRHPQLGKLYPDDMQALDQEHQRRGLSLLTGQPTLGELEDWEQQAIAVWRSQRASFLRLYQLIDVLQDQKPGGTKSKKHGGGSSIDSVEGLKDCIRPLTRRSVDPVQWLRANEEPIPLDTYRDRFPDGGVVIIEEGGFVNSSYIKSVWFGLAAALLCQDARMRYYTSEDKDPGARQRFTLILDTLEARPRPFTLTLNEDKRSLNRIIEEYLRTNDKQNILAIDLLDLFIKVYQEKDKPFLSRLGNIEEYNQEDVLTMDLLLGLYREIGGKCKGRVILGRINDTIPQELKLHLDSSTPYLPLIQFAKAKLPLPNCLYISELVGVLTNTQHESCSRQLPL